MQEDIILGGLSIFFVGMVALVPVLGITLRLTMKPFFDKWVEIQRGRMESGQTSLLERQVSVLEAELQQVQRVLASLVEEQEFDRRLGSTAEGTEMRPAVNVEPVRLS